MFGFIIGLASLFGLVHVLRGHRRHPYAGRCGRRGGRPRGGRKRWLRGLFERLETTPGQEKVIRKAVDDVMSEAATARRAWPTMRSSLGAAFGGDSLDDATLASAMAPADEGLERLRVSVREGLARIHEALDPDQRQTLARWLSRGGAGPLPFGPYR